MERAVWGGHVPTQTGAAMTLHYRSTPDLSGLFGAPSVDTSTLDANASVWEHEKLIALVPQSRPSTYRRWGKRALDVVLASAAMALSLPVLVILAIALWIEGGNPFYSQPRVGRHGRVFRMWKLRTMVQGAEAQLDACLQRDPSLLAEWIETQKLKNDPRVTPIGRLLRKTSMDELPQIFNVLTGDMSLVGPRPMLPEQVKDYAHPRAYMAVEPGITGLWQVTARNNDSFRLRAELDAHYTADISLWRDLRIIVATVGAVIMATGY